MKIIIGIVAFMILYDLSIHLVFLFKKENYLINKRLNWWPDFRKLSSKTYQIFWNTYWIIAAILILIAFFRI